MINMVISIASIAVLLLGILVLFTPIPFGVMLIAGSLSTLLCVNLRARQYLKYWRVKSRSLNHRIIWLEGRMGKRYTKLKQVLLDTRPNPAEQDQPD